MSDHTKASSRPSNDRKRGRREKDQYDNQALPSNYGKIHKAEIATVDNDKTMADNVKGLLHPLSLFIRVPVILHKS